MRPHYKRWEPKELEKVEKEVKKYLALLAQVGVKGHKIKENEMPSVYKSIKALNLQLPDRSWQSVRGKFNKVLRALNPLLR